MKVCAIRDERNDLPVALRSARQMAPELFPSDLPRLVVIKPNLCDITSWETGVTTDPSWLGALANELRTIRPDVDIRVVESDAVSAYKTRRSCDETFERLGYVAAAEAAGVKLVNLSRADSIDIRLEGAPSAIRMPEIFLEEVYFISIANLKVHPYTRMTGILKNSLGLVCDADISSLHPYLSDVISGLHILCVPDMCIIDGRIGLEGKGPILGDPVRMDTILFGTDALTTDQAACRLMGIAPREVPHLCRTAKRLGRMLGHVDVLGDFRPRAFRIDDMDAHRSIQRKFLSRRLHQRLESSTNRWIDRAIRLRREPVSAMASALKKLTRGRHGR